VIVVGVFRPLDDSEIMLPRLLPLYSVVGAVVTTFVPLLGEKPTATAERGSKCGRGCCAVEVVLMRLVKSLEDRSSRLVGRPRKVKNSLVSILLNERHGRAGQAFVVSQFRFSS